MVFYFIRLIWLCISAGHGAKDVVFVVDRSGSLDSSDIGDALEFIHNVTEWLNIGVNDTLISLVTYSDNVREEFKLGNYTNKTELIGAIDELNGMEPDGGTYTFDALEFVLTSSFEAYSGGRNGTEKAVVVITDGASSNLIQTWTMAERLRSEMNAEVYSIGIGSLPDQDELNAIANDPDDYYALSVEDYVYLCNLVPALVLKLDSSANATLQEGCPKVTSTSSLAASTTSMTMETTTMTMETTTTTNEPTTTTTEKITSSTSTKPPTSTTTEPTITSTTWVTTTTTEFTSTTSQLITTTGTPTSTVTSTEPFTTMEHTTSTVQSTSSRKESTTSASLEYSRLSDDSQSNIGLILGIVVGLLLFTGLLILYLCCRKKLRPNKSSPLTKQDYVIRQYTQTSLGAPKPLSYREATFTSDTNGLLRQSTTWSLFDVHV